MNILLYFHTKFIEILEEGKKKGEEVIINLKGLVKMRIE